MKYINANLITLKLVLFLFFGGIGCLFPFLPLHMTAKGLTVDESKIVSIVAPCIALIGPAIAGPLADRFAGSFGTPSKNKTGTYLRVFTAVCLILAAVFYSLLVAVPPIVKSPPSVTFTCDQDGGFILQQRCGAEKTCYNWDGATKGSVQVTNCRFACNVTNDWANEITTTYPQEDTSASNDDYDGEDYDENSVINSGDGASDIKEALKLIANTNNTNGTIEPHPHLCYNKDKPICEVYTKYSIPIDLRIGLLPSIQEKSTDEATEDDVCVYPLADKFHCRITPETYKNLTRGGLLNCRPVVKCNIHDPYNSSDSLLKVSQCGYNNISFYLYLFIRSFGDLFTAAAVALLGASVVIATRETSTGRGDVGKQFAAGALGLAIFAPIVGGPAEGHFLVALLSFVVLFVLAALILLFDYKMPLSPPEWWWHTRCGLLALPMSAVKRYGQEVFALGLVLFLLGIFWSALDCYLPWHIVQLKGTPLLIGLSITVGSLPAVLYLFFAEKIVDYCGHSNILIVCFVSYIVHFTALTYFDDPNLLLIVEALEIFTLYLMWVTAVLYLRHLVPRKFTACGQALPVIAHFCLGRFVGALLGGIGYTGYSVDFINVHYWFAVAAAVIGSLYFLVYHFYLKPRCAPAIQRPPRPAPAVVQSMNGNGSYTPLRVYHNGSAKKGQFRY